MKSNFIYQAEYNFIKFWRVHSEILTHYQSELRNQSIELNKQDIAENLIDLYANSSNDKVILNYGTSTLPLPLKWFKQALNSFVYDIKINGRVFKSNLFPVKYKEMLRNYSINETDKYTIRVQIINSILVENEDYFNADAANFCNWVFKYSNDINEIKNAYIIEQQQAPYNKLLDWQKECLLTKFNKKSYISFFDGGDFVLPIMNKLVFSPKGQNIDSFTQAWEMNHGNEIEPCEVASFLYDVYSGTISQRKTSDLMNNLARKYKTLTGKSLKNVRNEVKNENIKETELTECPY